MPDFQYTNPPLIIPLDDVQLQLIGKCVVVWNEIEAFMLIAVMGALQSSLDEAQRIMGGYNIAPKADIFESVINHRVPGDALHGVASDCAKRVKGLSNFRNDIAHGFWTIEAESGVQIASKQMGMKSTLSANELPQKYRELCKLSWYIFAVCLCVMRHFNPEMVINSLLPSELLDALLGKGEPPSPDDLDKAANTPKAAEHP